MASEFNLTSVDDLPMLVSHIHGHFESSTKPLRVVATQKSNGTISMLKLWRMWMQDIASYKASRGSVMPLYIDENGNAIGERKFNAEDAHEAYTYLCLGCDERGVRYSWSVNSDKYQNRVAADLGQRLRAMQKFHEHCIEHAVPIRIPERNEYSELMEKQNA